MDIKYGSGLEFESEDTSKKIDAKVKKDEHPEALEKIIRQGYRTPVLEEDQVSVQLGKKKYGVFNLAATGVGIFLPEIGSFRVGETIKSLTISLGKTKYKLAGTIVHISQDEANYLCGIELTGMDQACRKSFEQFLSDSKSRLFIGK